MTQSFASRLVSVNLGLPRRVAWENSNVLTGIFKEPMTEPVVARYLNLDGDEQADLTVHGGVNKAVYVYPAEHYDPWRLEFASMNLPWGMFGENFTTTGLTEQNLMIGERLQVGQAVFVVTQPRQPCYKLGLRFGRNDILRRFVQTRRTGWYLAVEDEGTIQTGDAIFRLGRPTISLTVAEIAELVFAKTPNLEHLQIAAVMPELAYELRVYFQDLLARYLQYSAERK
jgi:MOSC domain-containing protein YiiM